jgi:ribosomal protein S18 acetylase RimI-like enzyme
MSIACVDWREARGADLAQCYAREIRRWSAELGWDTASSWDQIEFGRRVGTLPGLLALDAHGAVLGWTFYLLHRGILQLGGFVSNSADVTDTLVDGLFASKTAARAESVTVFAFTEAPGLTEQLSSRGLSVGTYEYLVNPLTGPDTDRQSSRGLSVRDSLRPWRSGDVQGMAALLRVAYPGADAVRPFAPKGTPEEWREYVGQLVHAGGCGTLMADACAVHEDTPGNMSGVVLVTRLSPETAHIAQLAVDPRDRGRGLGRRLVDAACVAARGAGCTRMTLLVESRNVTARRLYEAAGFRMRAQFVSAGGRVSPGHRLAQSPAHGAASHNT